MSTLHPTIGAAVLEHGDDAATSHMSSGSFWTMVSMIAFSLFLLAFAWALLRPRRQPSPTAADIATERFARGEINAVDFERVVSESDSRQF